MPVSSIRELIGPEYCVEHSAPGLGAAGVESREVHAVLETSRYGWVYTKSTNVQSSFKLVPSHCNTIVVGTGPPSESKCSRDDQV